MCRYTKLNTLVDNLIKEHVGGQQFFSALDESLRKDSSYFEVLMNQIRDEVHEDVVIIVSGGFGMAFLNWFSSGPHAYDFNAILVPGGLRHNASLLSEDIFIENKNYIFLDDSFYSGATRNVIKNRITCKGGQLLKTIVVYDGAKTKDPEVEALYRYHP